MCNNMRLHKLYNVTISLLFGGSMWNYVQNIVLIKHINRFKSDITEKWYNINAI